MLALDSPSESPKKTMPCNCKRACPVSAVVSKVTSAAPEEKVAEAEQRLANFLLPAAEPIKFLLAGAFVKNWVALAADVVLSLVIVVLACVLPHNLLFNVALLYLLGFLAALLYEKLLKRFVEGIVAKVDGIDEIYGRAVHTVAALAAGCGEMFCAACRGAGERAEKAAKATNAEGLLRGAKGILSRPHVRLALVCLLILPLSLLISLKAIVIATVLILDGIAIARYLMVSGTVDKVAGQVKKQASKVKVAVEGKMAEGKRRGAAKHTEGAAKPVAEPAEEQPTEVAADKPVEEPREESSGESEGEDGENSVPAVSNTSPV